MALPKPNDVIVLLSNGAQMPGRRWKFSQLASAVASVQGEFLGDPGRLPLVIVPLKNPTVVLWRIEKP